MQYTYLVGVAIILFFVFMYVSEKFWLGNQARHSPPPEPKIIPRPEPPRESVKTPREPVKERERVRKKGRRR